MPVANRAADGVLATGAEIGRIEGRVENALTGAYLGNARVSADGTDARAFTNSEGNYRLLGLTPGPVRLRVFYTGLEERTVEVTVRAGEIVQQNFSLAARGHREGEATRLDPFVIAAGRVKNAQELSVNERRFAANIKNVVSGDQFGDVSDGNVGEFLKFLPGVSVGYSAWDANSVSLRGMPSATTNVTVDGADVSSVSSGNDRGMSLFGLSMNNVSRVEVTKSPTPDLPATGLGGSVNLIPASAFDRKTPQTSYRVYTNFNAAHATLEKVPAADRHTSVRGLQPGFDFKSVVPVNERFGYTVTGLYTRRYDSNNDCNPSWIGVSAAGAAGIGPTNPYLGSFAMTQATGLWTRIAGSASFDWKIKPRDVLSVSLQYAFADTYQPTAAFTANAGAPVSYGPTFLQGAVTTQPWSSYLQVHDIVMRNLFGKATYRHSGPVWAISAGTSYSKASYARQPINPEAVGRASFRMRNAAVRYDEIVDSVPTVMTAKTAAGVSFNPYDQGNLSIESIQNQRVATSDLNWGATADARRTFNFTLPVTLKAGAEVKLRKKDRRAPTDLWTFVGPDKVAFTADDLAANYRVMSDLDFHALHYGVKGSARWADLGNVTALFKSHPEYFQLNDVNTISTTAASSVITETISSGYLRADLRLWRNRLWLVGGVRYERTGDDGYGILNDLRATYQQDARGNLILGANGRPVPVTSDAVATARLRYKDRGAHATRDYGDFYPSFNATYSVTPQFLVRGAYARTIGRPNFSEITPGTTISDPASTAIRTITINNTALKPWTANSYDLSLEYYPANGTILSFGGFYKEIADFFGGTSLAASPALLADLGLGGEYADYTINTKQNVGDAKISGIEAEMRLIVPFLPAWGEGLQVYGNGTAQHLQAENLADFSEYMSRSANWGVSLSRPRYSVTLNWNFQGRIKGLVLTGLEPGSYRYTAPKTYVDLNTEFRLTRRIALYLVCKNLTKTFVLGERYGPNAAPYARTFSRAGYGRQMSVGLKGTF